jgi:hypothetical protein
VKKPVIRVVKWLGDIPVEATCSACADVALKAKGAGHRPSREEYQRSLQSQFDEHMRLMHSDTKDKEH